MLTSLMYAKFDRKSSELPFVTCSIEYLMRITVSIFWKLFSTFMQWLLWMALKCLFGIESSKKKYNIKANFQQRAQHRANYGHTNNWKLKKIKNKYELHFVVITCLKLNQEIYEISFNVCKNQQNWYLFARCCLRMLIYSVMIYLMSINVEQWPLISD